MASDAEVVAGAQVADTIDLEIHEKLRALRDEGEIEVSAFYKVSAVVVSVTKRYR